MEFQLQKEGDRVSECLDISTKHALISIVEEEIIYKLKEQILESEEFERFIFEQRIEDLRRLYSLLKRVNYSVTLKNKWVSILKCRGSQMLKDEGILKK